MYAFIKYYSAVILPVFKYVKLYTPKSIMGAVDSFKGPSLAFDEMFVKFDV